MDTDVSIFLVCVAAFIGAIIYAVVSTHNASVDFHDKCVGSGGYVVTVTNQGDRCFKDISEILVR